MLSKHLAACMLSTLVLGGTARAQNVLYQSDGKPDTGRPHSSKSHAPPQANPNAQTALGPQDALKTITKDVANLLNTVFGIRDGRPDDPSAITRE